MKAKEVETTAPTAIENTAVEQVAWRCTVYVALCILNPGKRWNRGRGRRDTLFSGPELLVVQIVSDTVRLFALLSELPSLCRHRYRGTVCFPRRAVPFPTLPRFGLLAPFPPCLLCASCVRLYLFGIFSRKSSVLLSSTYCAVCWSFRWKIRRTSTSEGTAKPNA